MALLIVPFCLLCTYLAYLCYRRNYRRHALVLGGFALFFLLVTISLIGASYYTWQLWEIEAITSG